MPKSTTIRLPGNDGPDIVIERRAFGRPRVTAGGHEIPPDAGRTRTCTRSRTADGTARSFTLKSDRSGLTVVVR